MTNTRDLVGIKARAAAIRVLEYGYATDDGRKLIAAVAQDVSSLCALYEASQAALADAIASNTANAADRDALASVVTRQRSEIDMLRDVPLLAAEWSKLRDQLGDARADADASRALLERTRKDVLYYFDALEQGCEVSKLTPCGECASCHIRRDMADIQAALLPTTAESSMRSASAPGKLP